VIRLELFQTIRLWHEQGMARREMARRLHVDIKTIRRNLAKIQAGATQPVRRSPASKLSPFVERIEEWAAQGRSAWSIYCDLRDDPAFLCSYELVKKYVAKIRVREPKVYERLEHPPGAEAQVDFGSLARLWIDGRWVTPQAFVITWPHSRWRYEGVVRDQTVPTFLGGIQTGIRTSEAIPDRLTIDNLRSGVLRRQLGIRPYQRNFADFCAHYGIAPSACRSYTPTDKGAAENAVGTLKKFLKGHSFGTWEGLQAAVARHMQLYNDRPNPVTGKRPNDLIATERRGTLPEPFPLAHWSEHRVRTDCHVQVRYNFYSVPYRLVGKRIVVRLDEQTLACYDDLVEVARHARSYGRGVSVTDRSHYPEHKRLSSHEIHVQREARIRAIGPGAAAFLHGLSQTRDRVHSDLYQALLRLIDAHDAREVELACRRAAHFGNYDVGALGQIIARKLFELPLDDLTQVPALPAPAIEIVRPLEAYTALFGGIA